VVADTPEIVAGAPLPPPPPSAVPDSAAGAADGGSHPPEGSVAAAWQRLREESLAACGSSAHGAQPLEATLLPYQLRPRHDVIDGCRPRDD
jgi:hypothetical protein